MKHLSVILLFLLSLTSTAQNVVFEAVVVDARNGYSLPFATVHVNNKTSTITNAEGRFSVMADSADVISISYVGYKSKQVRAGLINGRVTLEVMEMGLQEVTVNPIGPMIRKATKETLRQLQKYRKKKANFFYRQTAFTDTVCYEFAEAFLTGKSAVWLRDLEMVTGRYAGIRADSLHPYSYYGNFYTYSQVEIAWWEKQSLGFVEILPLSRDYTLFYNVDYEVIRDSSENRLFAIHFTPKPEVRRSILDVTLYIDEQSLHLRKMEGVGRNIRLLHRGMAKDGEKTFMVKNVIPTEFSFVVNMTEEHGFLEVQSVFVDEQHEYGGQHVFTRSILFNVGDKKIANGERMQFYGYLHNNIEHRGYDPTFWRNNEIVLRTPVEQLVMELFERNNLFGIFK